MARNRSRMFWVLFAIGSFALPIAACGGDDETSGTGGSGATGTGGSATGATGGSGGQAGATSGGSGGSGGACTASGASCLTQGCCAGLQCCSGVPIPPNEAVCYAQCPDSDRNLKQDFQSVNPDEVLERVSTLPISTWSYKTESPSVRHIGPMAQDFKATFDVGGSDRAIHKVDADGVALASIQALRARILKLEADNEKLKLSVQKLESKHR